jgi:c-di-GMP-binding flagellar brake protein YcgR
MYENSNDRDVSRRRYERMPFSARVILVSSFLDVPLEARSLDISPGGVALLCDQPSPTGQVVSMTFHIESPSGMIRETVSGRITNIRLDDDAAILGVEFLPTLDRRSGPGLMRAIESLGTVTDPCGE